MRPHLPGPDMRPGAGGKARRTSLNMVNAAYAPPAPGEDNQRLPPADHQSLRGDPSGRSAATPGSALSGEKTRSLMGGLSGRALGVTAMDRSVLRKLAILSDLLTLHPAQGRPAEAAPGRCRDRPAHPARLSMAPAEDEGRAWGLEAYGRHYGDAYAEGVAMTLDEALAQALSCA